MSATVITGKSDEVRADDEVVIGVEGLAGPDHAVPPAEAAAGGSVAILRTETVPGALRRRRFREAGRMRIPAQRVADENHVVARRRQCSVRLVRDADRMQRSAAVKAKRIREIQELRFDRADGTRGGLRHWRGHARDHIRCFAVPRMADV
jgi:hypothetical protein